MASFCGKAGPLGDRTPGCAVTCSCLVSVRLRQSWGKTQPLPGVVLREKNLFTDAESLFLCEVPPAHSVLFPKLTGSSSVAARAPPGGCWGGSASPGCTSWHSLPAGAWPGGHSLPPCGFAGAQHSPGRRHSWHRCLLKHPPLAVPRNTTLPPSSHATLLCLHKSWSTYVGAPRPLTWTMQGLEYERVSSSFLSALLYNPLLGTGSGCQIASYICSFPNAPLLGANEGLIIGCKYVVTLGK